MKQKKLVKTVILVLSAAMIGGCGAQGSNQGDSQAVQETSAAVSESQSSSDGAYEPVTMENGKSHLQRCRKRYFVRIFMQQKIWLCWGWETV